MLKTYLKFAILTISIFTFSCSEPGKPTDFDYGKVEDGKYLNTFFGFKMDLPAKWVVQTKEQTDNLMNRGQDLAAGDDEKLKAVLKASEVNSANLLSVFQHEVGAAVDFNANLVMVAENLKNAPGVKTGGDYLFQARKLLQQSQVKYDHVDEDFKKVVIGNHDFYTMTATINYLGLNMTQVYYATVLNGFSLGIIISYAADDQKNDLEKTVHSIKFND